MIMDWGISLRFVLLFVDPTNDEIVLVVLRDSSWLQTIAEKREFGD
jgi:hypothetical protein